MSDIEAIGVDVQRDGVVCRTPPSYLPASWRTVLPVDIDGTQGIAFDLADGSVVRLRIDAESAFVLFDNLRRYRSGDPRFQSPTSLGSPSAELSTPPRSDHV